MVKCGRQAGRHEINHPLPLLGLEELHFTLKADLSLRLPGVVSATGT